MRKAYQCPWEQGESVYSRTAPLQDTRVTHEGHEVSFKPTSEVGCDSGRIRTEVRCLTCDKILHPATTGPWERASHHWCDPTAKVWHDFFDDPQARVGKIG